MKKLPDDFPPVEDHALPWPAKLGAPTDEERKAFTVRRLELQSYIMKDFDVRMTPTAKLVALYLLGCVNSETMRCFPSYRNILDTLCVGKDEKNVQRAINALRERGWVYTFRPDRNKSNHFVFLRNEAVVLQILSYQDEKRTCREEERTDRELNEQTLVSGRKIKQRTLKSARERTPVSGKSFNTIHEPILGIERERYLIDGSVYASHEGEVAEIAYPVPASEQEAAQMLDEICSGRDPLASVRGLLMMFLKEGTLTPAKVDRILPQREEAA